MSCMFGSTGKQVSAKFELAFLVHQQVVQKMYY